MELRTYQRRAAEAIMHALLSHRRVLAVGPTGCGKTVVGTEIVRLLLSKRALWIAHRIELLRQARAELLAAGLAESEVGILSGPDKVNTSARVLVASVDILRWRGVPKAGLVVVDEAHRAAAEQYRAILKALPRACVLGLSATPQRLDGKGLDMFVEMVMIAGSTELIVDGFIAAPIVYGIPKEKARELVRGIDSKRGDYAQRELGRAMMKRTLMGDVVSERQRLASGRATIVFAVNVEHAQALFTRFAKSVSRVAYVDSGTPSEERGNIIAGLKSGAIEVVVNVDVLTEGFDCPPVKCIVLARPTKSLTRFLQQCGRASRAFGQTRPIILDHAGNTWLHGLPDSEREWSLEGRERGSGGAAPVKRCVECEAMIAIGCTECPECGAKQPSQVSKMREKKTELERLRCDDLQRRQREISFHEMAASRNLSEEWVRGAMEQFA